MLIVIILITTKRRCRKFCSSALLYACCISLNYFAVVVILIYFTAHVEKYYSLCRKVNKTLMKSVKPTWIEWRDCTMLNFWIIFPLYCVHHEVYCRFEHHLMYGKQYEGKFFLFLLFSFWTIQFYEISSEYDKSLNAFHFSSLCFMCVYVLANSILSSDTEESLR